MPETPPDPESAEAAQTRAQLAEALARGVEQVQTAEEAEATLDALEQAAARAGRPGELPARDTPTPPPQTPAVAASVAASAAASPRAPDVIAAVAREAAAASPEMAPIIDEAVADAMGAGPAAGRPAERARRGSELLRAALLRRLRPLDAIDAVVFLQINRLPHTPILDAGMSRLSRWMTGGHAWLLVPLAVALWDRPRAWRVARTVAPALWLATFTVELPIKRWFRRQRPFLSVIRAIIVGRKPGSYSFPSGHAAAAFAGAVLLSAHFPRAAPAFRFLAALVGFSRVYLGMHYPGDVLIGGWVGAMLARGYAALQRRIGLGNRS